jgi:serine-type D-Ala-D-Ala carboxypeptidase/endopeptidase
MEQDLAIPQPIRERIDELARRHVSHPRAAGLAVGIVWRGATEVLGYGSVRADGDLPPDGRTVFEIGSITKVFTTTLLADMVTRGEVALDDAIREHLPPEVKLPARGTALITLRQLATHTSGLPRLPANLFSADVDPENPYARYTPAALCAFLSRCRLRRVPGRVIEYSNAGAGLLGWILAGVAGRSYEELVRVRICSPLAMWDTGITIAPAQEARLAPGHAQGQVVPNWEFDVLAGAGALRSTPDDMLRFLRANLGQGPEQLAEAIHLAHRQQRGSRFLLTPGYYLLRMALALSVAVATAHALLPGIHWLLRILVVAVAWCLLELSLGSWIDARWGPIALGWHMEQVTGANEPVLWHNGGTGGYRSYLAFSREKQAGVLVLANSSEPDPDLLGKEILAALLESPSRGIPQ